MHPMISTLVKWEQELARLDGRPADRIDERRTLKRRTSRSRQPACEQAAPASGAYRQQCEAPCET